jgi:hypothetical protein
MRRLCAIMKIFLTFLFCQIYRKKYEIATDEVGNPIKQDEKKGVLREFKKGDIFFNYGCLPVSSTMFTSLRNCFLWNNSIDLIMSL